MEIFIFVFVLWYGGLFFQSFFLHRYSAHQAFTMSKLGHTFGEKEDIKAHLPVLKDFLFDEL